MIRLVIPEEPAVDAAPAAEARAPARQQLRIGTLDNSKSNADHLLGVAEATLRGNWELLDGVERLLGNQA